MAPTLRLEAVALRGSPEWDAWGPQCVGWWDEPRVDGHVVLRLDEPPYYPECPVHIAVPFSRTGTFEQARPEGHPLLCWGWDGNREAPTLSPSFVWPRDPTPPWPNVHLWVRAGRLVDAGSGIPLV